MSGKPVYDIDFFWKVHMQLVHDIGKRQAAARGKNAVNHVSR